jgi:hypothetical protein
MQTDFSNSLKNSNAGEASVIRRTVLVTALDALRRHPVGGGPMYYDEDDLELGKWLLVAMLVIGVLLCDALS